MKLPVFLTRNIKILSAISFATDIASEMLYPVLPLFLHQLGFGVLALGIIEGIADAIAGLTKVLFGYWSDMSRKRIRFIQAGYGLSALAKPLMGYFPGFAMIFSARFTDRFGKGVRTAARDAVLVAESSEKTRGRVFGFHRSMDTLGATIGPVVALLFLMRFKGEYARLFQLTLIPGIIALSLTLLLRKSAETRGSKQSAKTPNPFTGLPHFWRTSAPSYKRLLVGLILFALINSTDMFLLLRAKELFGSDILVIGTYIIFNLVGTIAAYAVGALADKFGFQPIYLAGITLFALVYSLMGSGVSHHSHLIAIFGLYGIFTAIQESLPKAWLSLSIDPQYKATGLGLYMTVQSLAFLVGTILAGFFWSVFGAHVIFSLTALGAVGIIIYFSLVNLKAIGPQRRLG